MIYLTLFAITFGGVAIRAFQQINVAHGHRRRIPVTSYLYATFDVMFFSQMLFVIMNGGNLFLVIVASGTGGWTGCFASMWLTEHLNKRMKNNTQSIKIT